MTPEQAQYFAQRFEAIVSNVERFIQGKDDVVRLALIGLVAEGHLLMEDVPGVGKTSLARSLSASLGLTGSRIQFTPDLLPSDVTGVTVYDQHQRTFEFHPGPVFHSIVLADEINRASPKTQSALLEVMEEGRVTVDGEPHSVGRPFMVIATQNPIEQAGTYRLPEAQLDRFLMKTSLGYPDRAATMELLTNAKVRDRAALVEPAITAETIAQMSGLADDVYVDPAVIGYVAELGEESRRMAHVKLGLSARGCLAFIRVAKTWAAADGRDHVLPDDVKALAQPVLSHRLLLDAEAQFTGVTVENVIGQLLDAVSPPTDRVA
jgi:MoxR-like ATPase